MKLEQQVCKLQQAKKLKEMGVHQGSSLAQWLTYCPDPTGEQYYQFSELKGSNNPDIEFAEVEADAFNASELFKILPHSVMDSKGIQYIQSVTKDWDYYSETECFTAGYYNFQLHSWHYGHGRVTTAEAAADLLITVIEQKDISVEELNIQILKSC